MDKARKETNQPPSDFIWNDLTDPGPIRMMDYWTCFSKSGHQRRSDAGDRGKGQDHFRGGGEQFCPLARRVQEPASRRAGRLSQDCLGGLNGRPVVREFLPRPNSEGFRRVYRRGAGSGYWIIENSMMRTVTGIMLLSDPRFRWRASTQFGKTGFPTQEDYCRDNPKAAMCPNGRPISADNPLVFYTLQPDAIHPVNMKAARERPTVRYNIRSRTAPQRPVRTPVTEMALQDWRFSHQSPAMLMSINIGSLLQSPMWAQLFSAFGAEGSSLQTAAIDKIRCGIERRRSDTGFDQRERREEFVGAGIGQGQYGQRERRVAAVEPRTQVKRIDAITTLIGEGGSLGVCEHADAKQDSAVELQSAAANGHAGGAEVTTPGLGSIRGNWFR